mmetsp:Transcript_27816/g.24610  ORF Transcript_27816/g.24610 Transcript_27816/m.24610 type:complete len:216 (-) Transcript_27816:20-667(-)
MFVGASSLFDNGREEIIDKKKFLGLFSQPLFNALNRHKVNVTEEPKEETKHGHEVSDKYQDRTDPGLLMTKEKGKVFDVSRDIILENINKIKDKLERHLIRKGQNLKDLWGEICKKRDLSPNKFVTRVLKIEGLFITEQEAQILYEFVDENNNGKVTYEDLAISCKDINVNVLLTRFKDKLYKDDEAYLDVFDKFATADNDDLNARTTFTMINNS